MRDTWIDSAEKLDRALKYWKKYSPFQSYIKLQDAIDSLGTDDRLVEARPVYASRWVLSPKQATGPQEAVFHTVGVYRWGANEETGNFVLQGEKAPSSVAESRIKYEPSSLCQFSYALDTHRDKTIWAAQKAFEEYVKGVDGFNKAQKQRRSWQDGSGADKPNSSFVFNSQIFVKRNATTKYREAQIEYELHPWIKKVTSVPGCEYFANPDRPALFELHQGTLRNIKECSPPYIKKGDLVWLSFSAEYIIGGEAWSTTFVPYEIIRVGTLSADLVGDAFDRSGPPAEIVAPRPRLMAGMRVEIDLDDDDDENVDVAMHNNAAHPEPIAAVPGPNPPQEEELPESNVIYLRPKDARTYGWETNYTARRSPTPPISWPPSPRFETDEDVTMSDEEAVASVSGSPSHTASSSPGPSAHMEITTGSSLLDPRASSPDTTPSTYASAKASRVTVSPLPVTAATVTRPMATVPSTVLATPATSTATSDTILPSTTSALMAPPRLTGLLLASQPTTAPSLVSAQPTGDSTMPAESALRTAARGARRPQNARPLSPSLPLPGSLVMNDRAVVESPANLSSDLVTTTTAAFGTPSTVTPLGVTSSPTASAVVAAPTPTASSSNALASSSSAAVPHPPLALASRSTRLVIKLPAIPEDDEHNRAEQASTSVGKGKKRAVDPVGQSAEGGRRSSARVARRRVV
ncbi:uncharacterized protein TRAVEDRAFT_23774 [Trametes versicolor FP-101664 SS1]|uniref:uncharacterized protein n=1 Tax=Trametes versicolor (strain FP-101664) TaxID=717944 RepID=UPI00046233A8|nr:uncharacterized protein TRAVEDRAFT_23774 [Trametes versicolor FP-101664 SS1]EIW53402.1 hypothetical protein TRAVEDRAFT_23774 [Trametes versicolor FP-101664 SS1]